MNKYKKLLSDTAVYGVGTFASKLLVFFLTRLYTECLTPSEYSAADLITNLANLLIPLAAVGICDAIFRFALDKNADKSAVLSTGALLLCCSTGFFLLLSPLLGFAAYFRKYIVLIVLYVIMSNFHSICAQYVRATDRAKLFAVQGIINTVLTISFNILFLIVLPESIFLNGVYGYVLSIVIADFLVGLFLLIYGKIYRDIRVKKFNLSLAKSMLKYSVPLIPTTIFWWITNVSDRYMLTYFCGEAVNGLYTASYKIPTLLTLVTGVFSEAWQFSAARENDPEERSRFYTTVFSCFQGIIFFAASGVIAFSKIFSSILFADDYYSAWKFIPILVISGVFASFVNFLASVYMVKKRSIKSFLTSFVGAFTNITLNFLFIPQTLTLGNLGIQCLGWGANGAAIATLISYLLVFVIRSVDARKMLRFELNVLRIVINTALLIAQTLTMLYVENLGFLIVLQTVFCLLMLGCNFAPLLKGAKTIIQSIKSKKQ